MYSSRYTVDSRLFETVHIRIIRLVRWRPPWICLPFNFIYSNFQLFEAMSIPLGANYRLNHPPLFDFFFLEDKLVRTLIFCDSNTFFFKKSDLIFMAIYNLLVISSKFQYSPSVQRFEANREFSILFYLQS